MGYDVHITRKPNWSDPNGAKVSRSEWIELVTDDDSLVAQKSVLLKNQGGTQFVVQQDTMAVWTAWPQRVKSHREALFWLSQGNVVAKSPDRDVLKKMSAIAETLGARVQGQDGEFYAPSGIACRGEDSAWWKIW